MKQDKLKFLMLLIVEQKLLIKLNTGAVIDDFKTVVDHRRLMTVKILFWSGFCIHILLEYFMLENIKITYLFTRIYMYSK